MTFLAMLQHVWDEHQQAVEHAPEVHAHNPVPVALRDLPDTAPASCPRAGIGGRAGGQEEDMPTPESASQFAC